MIDLIWKVILLYLAKVRLWWLKLQTWAWKLLRSYTGHPPISPPMPPVPPPSEAPPDAPVDTPECRIAVHETGHALAAWSCTAVSTLVHVTMNEENTRGGMRHSIRTASPSDLWCNMAICLAGVAAEGHIYGTWRSGPARGDLAEARALCEGVAGTSPPWPPIAYDADLPDFGKFFEVPLSSEEARALGQSYDVGRRVVEAHGARFTRCVSMLLHRRHLEETDLTAVLGTRAFLRFLNATGSSRIVLPEDR